MGPWPWALAPGPPIITYERDQLHGRLLHGRLLHDPEQNLFFSLQKKFLEHASEVLWFQRASRRGPEAGRSVRESPGMLQDASTRLQQAPWRLQEARRRSNGGPRRCQEGPWRILAGSQEAFRRFSGWLKGVLMGSLEPASSGGIIADEGLFRAP